MNTKILNHLLTDAERRAFERNGYIVIDSALSPQEVAEFTIIVNEIEARAR